MPTSPPPPHVVLVGPPAAGKTTVGAALAAAIGARFVDLDAQVAGAAGFATAAALIESAGISRFRAVEAAAFAATLANDAEPWVLATGGGTLDDPAALEALSQSRARSCWLDLPTSHVLQRLETAPRAGLPNVRTRGAEGGGDRRGVADPLVALLEARRARYAQADWHLDARAPGEALVAAVVGRLRPDLQIAVVPEPPEAPYEVALRGGGISDLAGPIASAAADAGLGRTVVVCERRFVDASARLGERLAARGVAVAARPVVVAGGEASKTLAQLENLWQAFAGAGLDRGGLVVGVGGGATTDVTAMAAATWMRGTAAMLVPTTLLAMADASVGGKTAINLNGGAEGAVLRKNAVGVFAQPRAVWAPLEVLATLPEREWRSGLAEIAKACLLSGRPVQEMEVPERRADIGPLLAEAIGIKAAIVAADSREAGHRALLNLGHTAGHALEAVSSGGLRHGEAVAAGMLLEARAAERLGLATAAATAVVEATLARFGLVEIATSARWTSAARRGLEADKKRRGERLLWPILTAPGTPEVVEIELTTLADALGV